MIGKTLSHYEILELIGKGGMSHVYLGRQIGLDRPVAIKILHSHLAHDEGFVARFRREAIAAGRFEELRREFAAREDDVAEEQA